MPALPRTLTCQRCGSGSYATEAGLRQHQRRYCRGPNSNDEACPVCHATFTSFRGMRQHFRLQHPAEYNRDLEAEGANARAPWTEDEENQLAREEAAYEGNDIYTHLLTISQRTKDAIKGRRRMASYKMKVQRFREEQEANTRVDTSEQQNQFTSEADTALRDFIRNIPDDKLGDEELNIKEILLNRPDQARSALDTWCQTIIATNTDRRPRGDNNPRNQRGLKTVRESLQQRDLPQRKKRRLEYRASQYLYNKDQKAFADKLLDGRDLFSEGTEPNRNDLADTCRETFSTPSQQDNDPVVVVNPEVLHICKPVTAQEITTTLRTTKSNAAGSDGMTLSSLKKISIYKMLLLYNGMLLYNTVPACLKKGRTIMIPKKDKDLHLVSNWRPITMPPVIARVLNKIFSQRLGEIRLHHAQRGFTKIDGCFANYATVETIMKSRKKKGQPLTLVFLDLSKAFDTVSHHSIKRALHRLNLDPKTKDFILEGYHNCSTIVSCGSNNIGEFAVNRGVKQGDPYSPFIFNAIIDELITDLQQYSGVPVGSTGKVSALAYADDIILAATNTNDAQRMLDQTVKFLDKRGLSINASKSISVITKTVPSKKKIYTATEPTLKIGEVVIPVTSIGNTFNYLGLKFSTNGLTPCDAENLSCQLSSIMRAPLKPHQKLCMVTKYLIPRYISSVQRPNINRKILNEIDKKLRSAIRKILSIFQHSSNSILYAPKRNGGLGIFNFSDNIPRIILSRWERIKESSELASEVYQLSSAWVSRLSRLIPPETASKDNVQMKHAQALQGSFSGNLAETGNHQACSSFISTPPRYWTGRDHIKAIQLRYNLLPCRGIPSNPADQRLCRGCSNRVESLSHILQRCPVSHYNRIKRHNFVVKRVMTAARSNGWTVEEEPRIRCTNGELKKPDLLLKKGNKIIISDIGVHWESTTGLDDQYHHKVAKYSTTSFVDKLQELYPNRTILVLPLIVGARGTWCALNNGLSDELDLNFLQIQDIICTTMRGGWILHEDFMKFVWRR